MRLYIDPGTGSMLFAIFIGVIGAANYLLRKWFASVRFYLSGGKKSKEIGDRKKYVIFSDDKRYWKNFQSVCCEFDKRGIDVFYYTASEDDPALSNPYPHIHAEFIGAGNKAFAKMNFLSADIVLATTPGLDVYQWKRSKSVKYYVHLFHAASDVTLYRMFGIDYYDALLLSGKYQIDQIREMESIRNLPEKELEIVGIPYLDDMAERLKHDEQKKNNNKVVLLAPSWGKAAIFGRYGDKIIEELLRTNYNIIIRPHPQSFISEKEQMDQLMMKYPESERLRWNQDGDNYEVLKESDIIISDFSGVIFDFCLVFDKPVIYTSPDFDISPYDAWWLQSPLWTFSALERMGKELNESNMSNLSDMIFECLNDHRYQNARQEIRNETWECRGEGAKHVVDYIVNKHKALVGKEEQ